MRKLNSLEEAPPREPVRLELLQESSEMMLPPLHQLLFQLAEVDYYEPGAILVPVEGLTRIN